MAYNIEEFKNLVTQNGGLAQANMYRVILPAQNQAKNLNLLCKATNMPGRQILTNERTIGVNQQLVGYGYAKENVTMTFNVLNNPFVRYFFEQWQSQIIDNDTYEVGYYNDYTKNIVIQQLKKGVDYISLLARATPFGSKTPQNEDISFGSLLNSIISVSEDVVYTCLLEKAFPVSLTGVQYNDNPDQLIEISVEFSYKNWRSTGENIGEEAAPFEQNQIINSLINSFIGP